MKYLALIVYMPIFFISCSSASQNAFQLKSKTGWTPEGTWYLTGVGTGEKLRKRPVFIFGKNNSFLDSSQSVCRLEKLEAREIDITPDSPTPFIEFDDFPKLQNCPNYMFAWDSDGLVILHIDKTPTKPKINFGFAPSEAWQVNLYINREYRLVAWIGGKKDPVKGPYPNEVSFPVLRGEKK